MLLGGVGDPKRGYVDYEFHDGNGCRYHVHIMHISRISHSYHTHITFISFTYHIHIIHISRSYHAHITFISCIYHVHIMHISHSYHLHIRSYQIANIQIVAGSYAPSAFRRRRRMSNTS